MRRNNRRSSQLPSADEVAAERAAAARAPYDALMAALFPGGDHRRHRGFPRRLRRLYVARYGGAQRDIRNLTHAEFRLRYDALVAGHRAVALPIPQALQLRLEALDRGLYRKDEESEILAHAVCDGTLTQVEKEIEMARKNTAPSTEALTTAAPASLDAPKRRGRRAETVAAAPAAPAVEELAPRRRGRATSLDLSARVRLLVPTNPKRPGSATHERFELYRDGARLDALLAEGVLLGDVRYDLAAGFIALD